MSEGDPHVAIEAASREPWEEVRLAAELFAVDPFLVGGVVVRARPGAARDRFCAWARELVGISRPLLRMPLHISEDRLLGGLSLADTLRAGRVVADRGLLAQADGGAVIAAMAERLEPRVTSHLCEALDRGELTLERDGIAGVSACRVGVLALDEGIDEERAPAALRDRLALHLSVDGLPMPPRVFEGPAQDDGLPSPDAEKVERARARLPGVTVDEEIAEALCHAAIALGIASLRAPLLAARVARVHAALEGRDRVEEPDAAAAARLVLGPRATRLPEPEPDDEEEANEPPPDSDPPPDRDQDPGPSSEEDPPLDDIVLQAARSGIPAGLLDLLRLGRGQRTGAKTAGHAGVMQLAPRGGRPAGVRPGVLRDGERLDVVETLRAAAPWQPLRRRERASTGGGGRRLEIRRDDFRIARRKQRAETSVIFCVDASGSAAMQRLAEAKGAVEQVLVDCYVRRDHVALIAFRGPGATLLLPPTRSLVRVRRCLADLAGGGLTPLAAGIDASLALALDSRRRGQTPIVVFMTDGRANLARDGQETRAAAEADALVAARAVLVAGVRVLFLDTAPRPSAQAQKLAKEMGARYLPLPYLDAAGISRQVQALVAA